MIFKRFELKYYLNNFQTEGLIRQLSSIMPLDKHCSDVSGYKVRSLYYDSHDDECLYEKQSGVLHRKKIRLRTYGTNINSTSKLEIKYKSGQLVRKESVKILAEDAEAICAGDYTILLKYNNPITNKIYTTFVTRLYKPKVIVEYQRVAYVFPAFNIRITFDKDLHSNVNHLDLYSGNTNLMPVILEDKQILEVKYDHYIPAYIKNILSGVNSERMAISKYTLARRFHKIHKWEDN